MLKNGEYQMREIASIDNAAQYRPFCRDNLEKVFSILYSIASSDESESKWEDYHKGIYQDNYQVERDGKCFVIQYDLVTESVILYEIKIK